MNSSKVSAKKIKVARKDKQIAATVDASKKPPTKLKTIAKKTIKPQVQDSKNDKENPKATLKNGKVTPTEVVVEPTASKLITDEEMSIRYPLLKDVELRKKFLNVKMTNNAKGRIRQNIKQNLKGITDKLLPQIIYSKMQDLVKEKLQLTVTDLQKLRILYNMLKQATPLENEAGDNNIGKEKKTEKVVDKSNKRYVVHVSNLPKDITERQIVKHFQEVADYITDVRIPHRGPEKKSAIAFLELKNQFSYEMALSKHHTMFNNKRIKVLYAAKKGEDLSKVKSKTAKLLAMQKSGQLVGSVPLKNKRSQRRKKMKEALLNKEK